MNLESKYKAELVKDCVRAGAYARRLEDKWAVGLLDLTIKFPDYPHVLAEGKIVPHQQFGPTLRQYEEGKRYIDAGGIACLIAWDKATGRMFVHHWAKVANKMNAFPPGGSFVGPADTLLNWLAWREEQETQWRTKELYSPTSES